MVYAYLLSSTPFVLQCYMLACYIINWDHRGGNRMVIGFTITYVCNQYLSPLKLWVQIALRRGVLDTTWCDQVCQWLAAGQWFSLGTSVSSTNKTDCHDITEILLKVALKTITFTLYNYLCHKEGLIRLFFRPRWFWLWFFCYILFLLWFSSCWVWSFINRWLWYVLRWELSAICRYFWNRLWCFWMCSFVHGRLRKTFGFFWNFSLIFKCIRNNLRLFWELPSIIGWFRKTFRLFWKLAFINSGVRKTFWLFWKLAFINSWVRKTFWLLRKFSLIIWCGRNIVVYWWRMAIVYLTSFDWW